MEQNDPFAELQLDLEDIEQQEDLDDIVELDAMCEHALEVCLPACEPPCLLSMAPLTDISGRTSPCIMKRVHLNEPQLVYMVNYGALLPTNSRYLPATEASATVYVCDVTSNTHQYQLKRAAGKHQYKLAKILGQHVNVSSVSSLSTQPVQSSSLQQPASLHTASSTVSDTTSSNILGDEVSARLDSFFSNLNFINLYSELGQEESTAHCKLAVMQNWLDKASAKREAISQASAYASESPASFFGDPYTRLTQNISSAQSNIIVLQQELADIVARKRSLRAYGPNLLGVYTREGSILHPPYPSRHAIYPC